MGVLKGFRDFLLRGNVIELATAVIVGAAFTAVVTAISTNIINPLIAAIGTADTPALSFQIRPGNEATTVDIGAVITAAINFFIVAAVVYFVFIGPMNKLSQLQEKFSKTEDEPEPATAEDLLTEIRDLLRAEALREGPTETSEADESGSGADEDSSDTDSSDVDKEFAELDAAEATESSRARH